MDAGDTLVWSKAELPPEWALAVLDQIAHPIFIKDRSFRWVVLNRALSQLLGHSRQEMLGKTDFDFFPREEAEFFRRKDLELFDTERAVHAEEPITDRQGRRHWLSTTKVPLRGPGGEITHLVGIISDITELKAAQESLREANEQLESRVRERTAELARAHDELLRSERLAVLGRLSGSLAHQIRNPLGAILNAASLIRQQLGAQVSPEVDQSLKVIEEESWGANRIISGLVDQVRVGDGQHHLYSVRQLVELALAAHPPPERIRVALSLSEQAVKVDRAQVVSALGNLLQNAYEAMPTQGTLDFSTSADATHVCLRLADSGPGISSAVLPRLFEPLMTDKPMGLGMGLSAARTLVERQKGTLVLARPGPGAVFEVRLPLAP